MESFEKTPSKQEPCEFSFFKTELFLEYSFMLLPGVVDRNEFTSDFSLLLAAVIQLDASMPLWKNMFAKCSLFLLLYTLHIILNPQNCLML